MTNDPEGGRVTKTQFHGLTVSQLMTCQGFAFTHVDLDWIVGEGEGARGGVGFVVRILQS